MISVVKGQTVDANGNGLAALVELNPVIPGDTVLTVRRKARITSASDGWFRIAVESGTYWVEIATQGNAFLIQVPNDGGEHLIGPLITPVSEALSPPGTSVPRATDAVFGVVRTDVYSSAPVVYLKSSVDALVAAYEFYQPTAASPWVVVHNKGKRAPVMITDLSRDIVDARIVWDGLNQFTVYFAGPQAGYAMM